MDLIIIKFAQKPGNVLQNELVLSDTIMNSWWELDKALQNTGALPEALVFKNWSFLNSNGGRMLLG